ncbi:hypothetical protein I4U23_021642 [Adineta vaga]|nr:hypothetical protein I4U23_021642 [Adineta vaga]
MVGDSVCLTKKSDAENKKKGLLAATDVNMINLTIKIDTDCTELALTTALVEMLKLEYVDTVEVSSSTDNNVPINRYGPLVIFWKELIYDCNAYCMPSLDAPLLGLKPLLQFKPDFEWANNTVKLRSKMILTICASRLDVDIDSVAQRIVKVAPSLTQI